MSANRRAQILMEPAEYEQLRRIARQRHVSVGELVRVAVRERFLSGADERRDAAARIAAMALPVGAWAEMKQEIEEAYDAGLPR